MKNFLKLLTYFSALLLLWLLVLNSDFASEYRNLILWVSCIPVLSQPSITARPHGADTYIYRLRLFPLFPLQSPFIAIVCFGIYLALWLVYGIVTFRTVPAEAESLRQDVLRARRELAARGIST